MPSTPIHPLIGQWADYLAATGAAANTIRLRTSTVAALMRHAEVANPLDLTRMHTIAFLGRPRAAWTKVTYWQSIHSLELWLVEFHDVNLQLLRGIPKPRTPQPVARPVDDATVLALLARPFPARTHAYVRLALYQCLRVHEIAKLHADDIDLGARWLTVTGKGGQTAAVPLHPEIVALAETMPEIGWWFPSRSRSADHVSGTAVSQTITAALRSVGSRATAHQLRDTGATAFQRLHGDIRMTQRVLRHRDVSATMKYTHVSDVRLQEAMDAVVWRSAA